MKIEIKDTYMELLTIICNLLGPSIFKQGFNVPYPKLGVSSCFGLAGHTLWVWLGIKTD